MPEDNPITVFAKTNFRNQERVFGIKADDRRRHMYIIGKTGMGKTNLLENLAIQDIRAGHGMCFIDPHGDVAQKLIKAVPPERINDVIYFDPADQKFPIAFNILEQVAPDQRSLVASGLVGVFKKSGRIHGDLGSNIFSATLFWRCSNTPAQRSWESCASSSTNHIANE
jgi:hypothetical protein